VIGRIPVTEVFGSYVNTDAAFSKDSNAHAHTNASAGNTTAAATVAGFDTLLTSDTWLVRYTLPLVLL
jgi:hypothetical protein